MVKVLFGLLFLVITIECSAQEILHKQLVYKRTDQKSLIVEMYYPSNENQLNPAIAFFHGGGWTSGNPKDFEEICLWFAQRGWKTFSFEYRLSNTSLIEDGLIPEVTPVEGVKDARSAVRWLKENSSDLMIDPLKIVVSGQSAGGQLALATLLVNDVNEISDNLSISPQPNAIILYSACVNTVMPWCEYLMPDQHETLWTISPYHNLKSGLPPIIAFHGEDDLVADYWTVIYFQQKANQMGNKVELITIPEKGHYLGTEDRYSGLVTDNILEKTHLFLIEHQLD